MDKMSEFVSTLYPAGGSASESVKLAAYFQDYSIDELLAVIGMEKTAYGLIGSAPGHDEHCWIDAFEGTPLFDAAVQLQEQDLEMRARHLQERIKQQAEQERNNYWAKQDQECSQMCLQKERLSLALAKLKSASGKTAAAGVLPDGSGFFTGIVKDKTKKADDLTGSERADLGKKQFALPEQKKFPIPDEAHGRNALARASQFGSPAVQAKIRAAVHKKFPGIKETDASKPAKATVKTTISKTASTKVSYQAVGGFPGKQLVGGITGATKSMAQSATKAAPRSLNTAVQDLSKAVKPKTASLLEAVMAKLAFTPGQSLTGTMADAGKRLGTAAAKTVTKAAPAISKAAPAAAGYKFPLHVNQSFVRAGLSPIV